MVCYMAKANWDFSCIKGKREDSEALCTHLRSLKNEGYSAFLLLCLSPLGIWTFVDGWDSGDHLIHLYDLKKQTMALAGMGQ